MPYKAYLYDEWGTPLSSEPQYFASPGEALKAQAELDAKIHDRKQSQYDPVTGKLNGANPISRGDFAAAGDAQNDYYNKQEDSMYQALMGMFGSNNGFNTGGGWTPGSTIVGGGMSGGFGGMGGNYGGDGGGTGAAGGGAGGAVGGAMNPDGTRTGAYLPPTTDPQHNYFAPNSSNGAPDVTGWRSPPPAAPTSVSGANGGQYVPSPSGHQNWTSTWDPNTKSWVPNKSPGSIGGPPATGGSGTGGGSGGGGGQRGENFGSAFERTLYESFTKPGWDPEPIINKGTDEIAQGESNALTELQARAASQGIEGGAVQGANREVLSDFAGKRATLARDTRAQAAREAEQSRQQALSSAGGYLGRAQDNARQDRNSMIQMMMQNMQRKRGQATDFSAAIASPRPTVAPLGGFGNIGRQKDTFGTTKVTQSPAQQTPNSNGFTNPGGRWSPSLGRNI